MPRAYVAVEDTGHYITILEDQGIEAIPLTHDSVMDNIRSLETCHIVMMDASSPSWVLRECIEHHKISIAVVSAPDIPVTAMVISDQELQDLLEMIKPHAQFMTPVDDAFVRCLARVKLMYPVRVNDVLVY